MALYTPGPITSERFLGGAFSTVFQFVPTVLPTPLVPPSPGHNNPAAITHPAYEAMIQDWRKWRLVYEGGDRFIQEYTKKFSKREDPIDFELRKEITPTPSFAKAAVNEIKNAIFQRMNDVSRKGGTDTYNQAVDGQLGGVDLKGSRMNWFIGHYILPELLVMKKVGVYVDNFNFAPNATIASKGNKHPYFYRYRTEDIRTWSESTYGDQSDFTALLLRDYRYIMDETLHVPIGEVEVFRFLWIADDGKVHVQFYDQSGNPEGEEKVINIPRIPFVVFEITDSALKDVANHQIALVNLESSDVSFILKGNLPFYVEGYDPNTRSDVLKEAKAAYSNFQNATPGYVTDDNGTTFATIATPEEIKRHNATAGDEITMGATAGRRYPMDAKNPPAFIAPPSGPIQSSMAKQDKLKEDVRMLVQLAVTNTRATGVSAESKAFDQQGLESGLSNIGLELENGENKLGCLWSLYEAKPDYACVRYPEQYSLLSPDEVQKKIKQMIETRSELPSKTFKTAVNKEIARTMLQCQATPETLQAIYSELEDADFYTSNPKEIVEDAKAGLVSVDTASQARGYPDGEAVLAAEDHAKRLARIQQSQIGLEASKVAEKQGEAQLENPAARGLPDLSGSPSADAQQEKVGQPGRGEA